MLTQKKGPSRIQILIGVTVSFIIAIALFVFLFFALRQDKPVESPETGTPPTVVSDDLVVVVDDAYMKDMAVPELNKTLAELVEGLKSTEATAALEALNKDPSSLTCTVDLLWSVPDDNKRLLALSALNRMKGVNDVEYKVLKLYDGFLRNEHKKLVDELRTLLKPLSANDVSDILQHLEELVEHKNAKKLAPPSQALYECWKELGKLFRKHTPSSLDSMKREVQTTIQMTPSVSLPLYLALITFPNHSTNLKEIMEKNYAWLKLITSYPSATAEQKAECEFAKSFMHVFEKTGGDLVDSGFLQGTASEEFYSDLHPSAIGIVLAAIPITPEELMDMANKSERPDSRVVSKIRKIITRHHYAQADKYPLFPATLEFMTYLERSPINNEEELMEAINIFALHNLVGTMLMNRKATVPDGNKPDKEKLLQAFENMKNGQSSMFVLREAVKFQYEIWEMFIESCGTFN